MAQHGQTSKQLLIAVARKGNLLNYYYAGNSRFL